jgi:hypothetical protein
MLFETALWDVLESVAMAEKYHFFIGQLARV